jgi:4-hydroxy-3-polyprenylbenzoate decarboxylase
LAIIPARSVSTLDSPKEVQHFSLRYYRQLVKIAQKAFDPCRIFRLPPFGFRPYNAAMSYRCLTEFLEELGHAGELARVEEQVDSCLQVAAVACQGARSGGPAILFGVVKDHDLPILCNLFSSEGRILRGLGVSSIEEATDRIAKLLDVRSPEGWFERLKGGSQLAALASTAPRKIKSAPSQQNVRLGSDINLDELPLLQMLPETAKRTLTAATVFSAEANSHTPVTGRFDLQQLDRARLAVAWSAHDLHARLLEDYRKRNQKMPLAVVIGGDPAFLLAAAAPLPPGADVCAVAGLMRERALDVVAGRSVDLDVPAEAEIILEGFVDPAETPVMAGPFCGPTGHATLPRLSPVMQVTALTHRANPILAAMAPGPPPHEAIAVARAMHRVFRPLVHLAMPELVDYDLPEFGAARLWAAVSIRKTYPGQGRRAACAAWNLPAMMFAKTLVVVDDDVDVHDSGQVLAAIAANVRPGRDVLIEQGPPDPLDPAMPAGAMGEKMALDATRKMDIERS